MSKQSQKTAQTKKNIAETFIFLCKTTDIKNITVKQVIEKAGYNRATFYRYFEDINSLLNYIEDDLIESTKILFVNNSLFTNFNKNLSNIFIEIEKEYGDYVSILSGENGDPHFISKFKNVIKSNIYTSLNKRQFEDSKFDISIEIMLSSIISAYSYWKSENINISAELLFSYINNLLNNGIFNDFKTNDTAIKN